MHKLRIFGVKFQPGTALIMQPLRERPHPYRIEAGVAALATQAGVTASAAQAGVTAAAAGASASSAGPAAPPALSTPKVTICCSFGARTLASILRGVPAVREMFDLCWGKDASPKAKVPLQILTDCMTEYFQVRGEPGVCLHFVDCRSLYEPPISTHQHVGLHEDLRWGYMTQVKNRQVLNSLQARYQDYLRNPEARKHIFCFYCNAGEHRSVAMAETFRAFLKVRAEAVHCCSPAWRRRYCGGCAACVKRGPRFAEAVRRMEQALT